jgi:demethylmenaquinone methyltransferase/2-methoxy-6-polyprenyl-1,4-benzoquinol methylase
MTRTGTGPATEQPPKTGQDFMSADENRRMFDDIAGRYDLLNHLLSFGMDRGWRRRAVESLAPQPGKTYLDVGCGTGDLCVEILRREPAAAVIGLDLSEAMLARAGRKLSDRGLSAPVRLLQGDATALAFEDSALDGVVSGFCIRNITDRPAAFLEMQRVTRAGGGLAVLELTTPGGRCLRALHRFYNRHVVPFVGGLLSRGAAYRYLADSIADFPCPDTVRAQLASAGWADVAARPLNGGIVTLFTGECGGTAHD